VPLALGVDIGGTKIAAGLVDGTGEIVARESVPTVTEPDELRDTIAGLVRGFGRDDVSGIGVGVAGLVEFATGVALLGPNLGMRVFDLGPAIAKATGMRVVVDNDANAATWAEHRFGAGRGTRDFLCVTLGTGIGGGIVAGGMPYRGARGGAAEIGHILVDPDGPMCGCGKHGCWEQMASGKALERTARERIDPGITGPMVTDRARVGDPIAREIVDDVARWIGRGLASLVNVLEPERIAIGGGMSEDWDLFEGMALEALRDRVEAPEFRPPPPVVVAELGVDAGVVGAALLALA
jgi:glucokinase